MLIDEIEKLVRMAPGLTATRLAKKLYGVDGYNERVTGALRELCGSGQIERRGSGGPANPFTYYPRQEGQPH